VRSVVILAGLCVVAAPTEAGPGKHGRIVRVERPRTGSHGTPRVCQLSDTKSGTCYGKGPTEGETAWLIDNQKNRGQIRITKVTASTPNCTNPQFWSFELEPLDADLKDIEPYRSYVLLDIDAGSEARVIDTSRLTAPDGSSPWLALDRGRGVASGGDDAADVMVTAYGCDSAGQRITSGGYGGNGYCLDYFFLSGGHWDMSRHDVVTNCAP